MRKTSIELLKLTFKEDEQRIKNYIIDDEVDVIVVGDDMIVADEFCNNIHKYMGEQAPKTN